MKREPDAILVIDDDDMNLQIAKMILEKKLPCKVVAADNGLLGLNILRSQKIKLVLLDIMMPDFDGIETLREIRADDSLKDIPVMMLTASGESDDVKAVQALGVTDYIRKPFMPAELVERVDKKLAEISEPVEKVLIVGDNEKTLAAMLELLDENFPHEFLTSAPADAAEILRKVEINLVVACADMKFIDGLKLLKLMADEFDKVPFAVTAPEKIFDAVKKINPAENSTENFSPMPVEKKKLAAVVTNAIGYELDLRV